MAGLGGKINRTTKNVKAASVNMRAAHLAQPLIKPLRAATAQIRDAADTQIGQVPRYTRAYARNALKVM